MALKAQAQFTNKYEQAFNQYRSSPFFNEEDWRRIAMGNDASNLDMYINALSLSKDINKKDFDEKYTTEFQDSDTRLAALYNEVYGSRVANDDRYSVDVYKYDDVGNMLYDEAGNPKTERKTISEYQYNKMIISQQNEARRQAHLKELAEEAKDPNAWATAGALVVDVAFDGMVEFFNKTGALGKTLIDMARSDKTFANDWFTQWENNYKPVLDRIVVDGKSLSQHMLDFEKEFTHLRDTDGNLTGFGRIATGVATTSGEMLGSIITGGILAAPLGAASAGAGATAKIATGATKVIRTAAYYAPLAAYGMGESYKEITANGNSIATSKMITNQLWKTGAEISIEMALGKVFGTTGLDKMLFGRTGKIVKKTGKAGMLGGLAHFAGEALQEGTEEFLQEYSGFLVDNAYSKLVDESFKTEFSMQNLVDAAIIGAIISAASSITTISATKGKIIDTEDGTIKLGKIASAYYNASIPTFLQKLETAQKSLDDLISGIPSSEKIEGLTKRKAKIESELKSINEQISKTTFFTPDVKKLSMAQELASDIGKGYALNQSLELVKNKQQVSQMPETLLQRRESLQRSLLEVDSQIGQASKISAASESTVSSEVREEVAESFRALYTAARAVQSFVSVIGEARMTKAAEILGRIEKMGDEGKFDKTEVSKARNEMVKELRLIGVSVDRSFIKSIADSGMTKIKKVFKRSDFEGKSANANYDKNDYEVAKNIMDSFANRKTVTITEDGDKCAVDDSGENIAIPSKEVKAGAAQILHDEAERRLVSAILKYKFSGDVIDRVVKTYRQLYKAEATTEEAINAVIFDETFYLTMLTGENQKNVKLSMADLDMFKFLSALSDIEKLVINKDIRDGVYKTKIEQVRKSMAKSLTQYLKLQPDADYELDILSKKQKDEIREVRESFNLVNRIVSNKATEEDMNFIYRKINFSSLSKADKDDIKKKLLDKNFQTRKDALVKLDESYRVAFYGAYDGITYMPLNSLKNQALNQLLFKLGIKASELLELKLDAKTLEVIQKNFGGTDVKNIVRFYSAMLLNSTGGRYGLEIATGNTVKPENGVFKSGKTVLKIVDRKSTFESSDFAKISSASNKTHVRPSGKHASLVTQLLSDSAKKSGAGYYTVNDIVADPSLLKESTRFTIAKEYLEVTPDTVYAYIKSWLSRKGNLTLSRSSDGGVIIVDVSPVKDVLANDFSIDKVKDVVSGSLSASELVEPQYRVPLLDNCQVVFADSPEFYVETSKVGKNRGVKTAVIRLSKSSMNDLEALKTEFAHEFQHLVQEVTSMNVGASSKILSIFSKEDKEQIKREVMKHVPSLFKGVSGDNSVKIDSLVNQFLYYGSGESAAYGVEASDAAPLYPVLIRENESGTLLTLPWGTTFAGGKLSKKQMSGDTLVKIYNIVTKASEDLVSLGDVVNIVDDIFDIDPSIQIPTELKNRIIEAYRSEYGNESEISFVSTEDIKSLKNDGRNYAGLYSRKGGILINRDVLIRNINNGNYQAVAKTILHEMIHAVTRRHIHSVKRILGEAGLKAYLEGNIESPSIKALNDVQKAALSIIKLHHELVKDEKALPYGLTSADEMVAELANPSFRDYLKTRTLWDRLVDAIKRLLGIQSENALTVADKALNDILSYHIEKSVNTSDSAYFEAVKNEDWDTVRKQVRAAASMNGYYSTELYHGTKEFGFTKPDVSFSDDKLTFFASDNIYVSRTYAYANSKVKNISESKRFDVKDFENERNILTESCSKLIDVYSSAQSITDSSKKKWSTLLRLLKAKWDFTSSKKSLKDILDEYSSLIYKMFKFYINDEVRTSFDIKLNETDSKSVLNLRTKIEHTIASISSRFELDDGYHGIYSLYANLDNSLVFDAKNRNWNDLLYEGKKHDTRSLAKQAFEKGYDLVIIKDVHDTASNSKEIGDVYIFRDPARQLRSSDLVTYDDDGNIIPLSERFDPENDDLRFDIDDEILGDEVLSEEDMKKTGPHTRTKGRKERGYVSKKFAEGTPLEPYARKTISIPLQELIFSSENPEYKGMDKEFLDKIRAGEISEADVNEFIRNADSEKESDVITFNLINKTFFKNRKIKSLQELEQLVYQKAANYYAIRRYLIESGQRSKLMNTSDPALYDFFLDEIQNNLSVKRKYAYLAKTYDKYGRISDKYLKLLYMQHFDGSVETAGYVASVAKVMGYTTIMAKPWKITGVFGAEDSLDREAGESKEGNTTRTLEEMIPDRYDLDEAQRFMDEEQIEQLISAMEQELYLEAAKLAKENKIQANTYTEFIAKKNAIRPKVEFASKHDWPTYVELLKKYLNISYEERMVNFMQSIASNLSIDDAAKDYDEVIDDRINAQKVLKDKFRLKRDIVSNIEHMCATIRRNLNAKERKLFLKDNSDLFTEDLKVEPSLYKETLDAKHPNSTKTGLGVTRYFDESVLIDIERRVRQLSKDVRSGVYSSEMSLNYKKQLEKRMNSYIKEILKLKKQGTKVVEKIRYVNVGGNEIGLNSFVDPPDVVKRFLDRALYTHTVTGKPVKTEVQELSGKDEYHIRMNYNEFLEINAETLNHLTQDDVEEIIKFYLSGARPATRNAMYSSIELWTLGYLIKMSGNPSVMFTLSDAQLDKIEKHLKDVVSDAGTIESVWKSVLKQIRPEETIHKAMLKVCGIELSPATEGELIMAINSHDVKRIQEAKQRAYREAFKRYKNRKRTIFDRLLRYERMAMLSGPGTWVRNQTSNALVTAGNWLSENLVKILPESKKHKKLNQYKIIGTKVTSGYSNWIKTAVIDSGMLELVADGLVKYDPRQSAKHGVENQLTKLIVAKVESDLFNNASSSNDVAQFLQNVLRKVMSDKFFINRSFIRYLGKMLTEDRTDVSQGLTDEVMNTIADAYVMSLQDYMHTNSFFGKLEGTLRTYLHRRFNPTTADGIFFLYKQVFPFANASWNWFMEGLKYTPVGLAVGIKNFCRLENTVNRMEDARQKGEIVRSGRFAEYLAKRDIGKGAIGSVGLGLGILLVALGKVRLDEDDDKYKLYIDAADGPIYVDFSDVFGTNGILLGMSIGQSFRDSNGFNYDSFMKVLTSSLNTMFLDSTFADMFNTFRYSESFGDYLTTVPADIAGMFVPNFIKTLGNTFKKYNVTYSSGLIGKLERFSVQSFAPFSYLMPYVVNPYTGEPEIINEGWFGINIVNRYSPIKVKNYNFGDVEKTAVSLGVRKGQLSGKYKVNDVEVKLSSKEIEALNQFYGKLNSKELEDFMTNKTSHIVENSKGEREELTYRKMNDEQKKAVIERIMSNNGQLAKVYILTSSGYKYYASDSEFEKLRQSGVTANVYRKVGKYEGFVKN